MFCKSRMIYWWSMKKPLMRGWEVDTIVELPGNEYGDALFDEAKHRLFECATKEAAIKKAKELLPQDCLHAVLVTEFWRELREPEFPLAGYYKEYGEQLEVNEP